MDLPRASREHPPDVLCGLGFLDQRRGAGRPRLVALAVGGETELREEHVGAASKPSRDAREERHQRLVGAAPRPPRIDRVPVHREEVARLRGLVRPQPAILLQVLHVDPDRDLGGAVGRADRRRHPRQPSPRELAIGGNDAVRVLVAQIPRPQCRVSGERVRDPARQQRLRLHDMVVQVPIPQPVLHDPAARHDPETCVAFRATQCPRRDPVDTAHVPGEQGRHQVEAGALGEVRHRDQASEHQRVDAIRLGLERFPQQEHADRVESAGGDPREVLGGLPFVEHGPPTHRGAARPVVDAEPERLERVRSHGLAWRSTIRR